MTESPFVKAEGPEPPDDYYREQMKPSQGAFERILNERVRVEMELSRQRNKLDQATDELNRVSNALRHAESKLLDAYQLVSQLSGYLDSIEWGTHEEWTRSQPLRERAHEYVGSFTYGFNIIAT